MTEIDDKYNQLGGKHSFLGHPYYEERSCPDEVGRYRTYKHGSIHWHPSTGAHETHGAIRNKWAQIQFEVSPLGYPTSDERDITEQELLELLAPGRDTGLSKRSANRCSEIQHGKVFYWSPDTRRYFTTVVTADGARTDEEHGKHGNQTNHAAEAAKCAGAAAAGAAAGYGAVAVTGMTAVGMMGSGAGIGAAAGPVGAAAGAVVALAAYGVWKVFQK